MIKSRKNFIFLVLFFAVLSIILGTKNVDASSSDLFLNNLDFDAKINSDGSMNVTEIWNIRVEDTNTLFKVFKTDGSKYSGITNVQVADITNGETTEFTKVNSLMYHVTKDCYYGMKNSDGDFEIAWGVDLENTDATKKYKITYTVTDAIAKYNDYAELYWQFVGKDFEINANKISGTITLPNNVSSKEEIKVWGHTENLNGTIYATDTNKIKFDVDGFNSGKYIEIRTLFPTSLITNSGRIYNKEILNDVVAEETKWADEANERRAFNENMKFISAIVICIISVFVDIILVKKFIKYNKEIKKLNKLEPTQELKYFREIPQENSTPAEAVYLITKKMSGFSSDEIGKIFSATLLNLNLMKLIDFEIIKIENRKEKIVIKIINELDKVKQIGVEEISIYNFIKTACGIEKQIEVKELEKYIKNNQTKVIKLKESIDNETENSLIFKKDIDEKEKEIYKNKNVAVAGYGIIIGTLIFAILFLVELHSLYLLGIGLVLILSIINICITIKIRSKINVFTQKGVDEIEKWKGLKNYMEDFSMLDKREVPEIVIWERFLVYATAFGIADKVLKQLKIVYPNFEEISDLSTSTYMHLMLYNNFSSSFSNSISTSMSTSYSSGTGGGGGFSGGGGGGRWPAVAEVVDNIYCYLN